MQEVELDYSKYFPLKEYYKRVVQPISSRFVIKGNMMLCPLHEDRNPSMGIINTKKGEIYHCFGCNSWGNVVDLHIRVSRKYFSKAISEKEAIEELCNIFEISSKEIIIKSGLSESPESKAYRRQQAFKNILNSYSEKDYDLDFLHGKQSGRSIAYFNANLVQLLELKIKEKETKGGV